MRAPGGESPPLAGAARLLRVGTLSGTSLGLAVAAHVLAGGALPSAGVVALVGSLLVAVALLITQWRCRLWVLMAVVALEQVALHLTLPMTNAVGCMPSGHDLAGGVHDCVAGAGTATMPMPGLTMLLSHVVATVVVVLLLWRGEAWLWRVAARLLGVPSPGPVDRSVPRISWAGSPRTWSVSVAHCPAAPRGPPEGYAPA